MKKLMIATLGLAVAGSVFGAPQVFDYKASVKHMYLKQIKVKTSSFNGAVYQKYAKSASLKGYLIMDADGVTSPTVTANETTPSAAKAFDYGRNRGFLVVQNSKAEKAVRAPKILPAVLDAKWIDTAFKKGHEASSGLAEGTLFVGGDSVEPVRPQLDLVNGVVVERTSAPDVPGSGAAGMTAYADYVWTSVYLFGQFNGPNWFTTARAFPFAGFEAAWDANLPQDLQTLANKGGVVNAFHDTWMNGAGIGKYTTWSAGAVCCGLKKSSGKILASLTGNLKGGLYICTDNGINPDSDVYGTFDQKFWEDQFNCAQLDTTGSFGDSLPQTDLWNDGAVEQATTDVIYGSWSIKWSKKWFNGASSDLQKSLTDDQKRNIVPAAGTDNLWAAINGAALKLNKSAELYDGDEIFAKTDGERFDLPVVTPQFATYYGLK